MATTQKGNITAGLAIAFASENPVAARFIGGAQNPGNNCYVSFSTDLADGTEGIIAVTIAKGLQGVTFNWPSSVRWEGGNPPSINIRQPVRNNTTYVDGPESTAIFKFFRDGGAGCYHARMIAGGTQ